MSENPTPEPLAPPERDTTVPPTVEQSKRKRRLIWLIVRLILVALVIALVLWGMVSCVNALTDAASTAQASLVIPDANRQLGATELI